MHSQSFCCSPPSSPSGSYSGSCVILPQALPLKVSHMRKKEERRRHPSNSQRPTFPPRIRALPCGLEACRGQPPSSLIPLKPSRCGRCRSPRSRGRVGGQTPVLPLATASPPPQLPPEVAPEADSCALPPSRGHRGGGRRHHPGQP